MLKYIALQGATDYEYLITALNYPNLWLVPVVAHTVFRTTDDGRKEHPKHVE
jgi:hypothetical protein